MKKKIFGRKSIKIQTKKVGVRNIKNQTKEKTSNSEIEK